MESTKGSKSEDESEEEEEGEEEEGEGDEGEKMGVSERVEVGGVENMGAGSNIEEPEHEDEEPDGSAKLWQADSESEEANKSEASIASESRERAGSESVSPSSSPVGQLASKVESSCTVSVKAASPKGQGIKDKAAIEAYKQRAREKQKHHSRRGAERIGRAKGSKAKQDNRVKLDKGGLWD